MLRAMCLVTGVLMLVTGRTPFDYTSVHLSANGTTEMAVSVLVLMAVLAVSE